MDLFESFATATFNYNPDAEIPLHPVTFYNLKTQQPVKIDVLPDTGASITVLNDKYAKLLGVDVASAERGGIEGVGERSKGGFYALLPMRIANLGVVMTRVIFVPNADINILGRERGFGHFQTTFTWNKLYYQELVQKEQGIIEEVFGLLDKTRSQNVAAAAAAKKKAAAFAQSYAAFSSSRGRR